ncbi:MAG TPA: DUF1569 domain-containing protein [bacterium]|nr:DUF1569 domain-containing protein [bacterium]
MPRDLRCKNIQDIRAELDRLGTGVVETTGNWSYFQIIDHLAQAVEGSMKGVKREMPWWKKRLVGPLAHFFFVLRGYIPRGIKGRPPERIEGDAAVAVARLRKALEDFERHHGPWSDHPLLGALTKTQWAQFHRMHFNNHVSNTK